MQNTSLCLYPKSKKMHTEQNHPMKKKSVLGFLHFDKPTSEQVNVLNAMESFVNKNNTEDFMVVCGSAGTGKSSIMNAVVLFCQQEHIRLQIAAPTARAARLIAAKTSDTATTLHSLLFSVSTKPDEAPIQFTLKKDKEEDYTIFIIDEASMVNSQVTRNHEDELFSCNIAILNAIHSFVKSGNQKNKVIFVGDRYQLAPVGETESNALYPTYLEKTFKWKGSVYELTEVKRQQNGSYILDTATDLRNSMIEKAIMPAIKAPKLHNVFHAVPKYLCDLQQYGPNQVVAIAATHKQNRLFNNQVRTLRFGSTSQKVLPGDVLTIKRNWKRNGCNLYNGDMVIVKEVSYDMKEMVAGLTFVPVLLRAKNEKNEEIIIADYLLLDTVELGIGSLGMGKENPLYAERNRKNKTYRQTGNVEDDRFLGALRASYGYCITCNSAQGGEWDHVYLNTFFIPDTRWGYTAVTRAKNNLSIF